MITGNWVGGIRIDEMLIPILVEFREQEDIMEGEITFVQESVTCKIYEINHSPKFIEFWFHYLGRQMSFSGKIIQDNKCYGTVQYGEYTGFLHIEPYFEIGFEELKDCVGSYKKSNGSFIDCEWNKHSIKYVDFESGKYGIAFPTSPWNFNEKWPLTDNFGKCSQTQMQFLKDRSNGQRRLHFIAKEATCVASKFQSVTTEKISFTNDKFKLVGTLYKPAQRVCWPAVVMIHDQGSKRNGDFWPHPMFFARHGIGVLTYDKRGTGNSQGNWQNSTFSDLADDALGAIRYLQSREDVMRDQIGLWAQGEGGYISSIISQTNIEQISWFVFLSFFPLPPAQKRILDKKINLTRLNFNEQEISEAVEYEEQVFEILGSDYKWNHLDSLLFKFQDRTWFPYADKVYSKYDKRWDFFRLNMHFDPMPFFKKIAKPVLNIFPQCDGNRVYKESLRSFNNALKTKTNITYKLIPNCDYSLLSTDRREDEENSSNYFSLDAFITQIQWIEKTIFLRS